MTVNKPPGCTSMKKKLTILILCIFLAVLCVRAMGIGYYISSSAVRDLRSELETIYGEEYTGKMVENKTEDLVFTVEPKSWFCTNWNLRNFFCIDYKYECSAVFTTYSNGDPTRIRTITYQAFDPMGAGKITDRAYLSTDTKSETTAFYP